MKEQPCRDCRFWEPDYGGPREIRDKGTCRRHAPDGLISTEPNRVGLPIWPRTACYDWCADFQSVIAGVAEPQP